ncbi:MAG TPA: hypothetical protein VFU88_17650, partial [Ktedonobacterales bacterium]|nr:hypothetical protein [Ktedonobacterales bacterium]
LIFNNFVVGRPVATHPLATPTASRPTATPQPLALPPDTMLADLSLLSSNEGWAVGDIVPGAPAAPRSTTVFLHLAGGSWTLTDQRFPGVHVETISMASADEGWAGGDKMSADHTTLVGTMLHFSHGLWSEVVVPNTGNISKVQMLSADEGWALATRPLADATCPQDAATCSGGSGGGNAGPSDHFSGILHYQHGVWSPVTFPASFPSPFWLDWHAGVVDLSMASPDDGWAVCQRLLVHYSHGEWQYRGMLDGLGSTNRIAMISPTDGWIGGPTESVSNPKDPATPPSVSVPAAYHYDGTAWRPATLPAGLGAQGGAALLRFQPGPAGSVYLLAGAFFPGKITPTTVLRYVGGTWHTVPFPGDLFITAIDDGWALGWVQGQQPWVSSILYERPSGEWAAYPVTR